MTCTYLIAGMAVSITSIYRDVHEYCRDYAADAAPELAVATTRADIEFERERSLREAELNGRAPCVSSDGVLEELAVYRKIAERAPERGVILFHGSALAADGEAYLFTAPSGTGKSTHARLWRELLGDRVVMVNDDKPLLRIGEAGVTVCGTPWNGKHRLGTDISVPLRAVCFLHRAKENAIRPTDRSESYAALLQQVYRPLDPAALAATLRLVDRLAETVPMYRMGCNMEPEAARVAFEAMKGAAK